MGVSNIEQDLSQAHVCSTCWSDISGVFDFGMLWNSDNYFLNMINY